MFWGSFSDAAWADVPPCPQLAAMLDMAALDELADDDLLEPTRARHRQIAAAQRAQLRAVAELARRRLGAEPGSQASRDVQYLDSEIAAALRITERAAGRLLFLALVLTSERAASGELLATGLIDLGKACVFVDELDGIDEDLAKEIEARLLPQAPALTSGKLRSRIRRMIEKADPEAAARRKRDAIASRDVTRWQNRDRTHTVAVKNVNGTTAGRITARIAARARALKNDGDPRPLHQIRADLASAILLGEYPNGYQPPHPGQPQDPDHPRAPGGPVRPNEPEEPSQPDEPTGSDRSGEPEGPDEPDSTAMPGSPGEPRDPCGQPHEDLTKNPPHERQAGGDCPSSHRPDGGQQHGRSRRARPADDIWPRAGPPASEEDRPPGEPALDLPFDDHKRAPATAFPQPRLGHREPLHTHSGEHDRDDDPELHRQRDTAVRVAADIARSLAGLSGPFGPRPRAPAAVLARHAATITQQLTTAKSSTCIRTTLPGGTLIHGTGSYRPSPTIQRHIARRDQTCQFPACNRRAEYCDLDHTTPYHHGRVTCPCNIVTLCRHHHILKQDNNWHVFHPWPGILIWITPAGQWHVTVNDNLPELSAAPPERSRVR